MRSLAETLAHDLRGFLESPGGLGEVVSYKTRTGETYRVQGVFQELEHEEREDDRAQARLRRASFLMTADPVKSPATRDTVTRDNGEVWVVTQCPVVGGLAHLVLEKVDPIARMPVTRFIPRK